VHVTERELPGVGINEHLYHSQINAHSVSLIHVALFRPYILLGAKKRRGGSSTVKRTTNTKKIRFIELQPSFQLFGSVSRLPRSRGEYYLDHHCGYGNATAPIQDSQVASLNFPLATLALICTK